MLYTAIGIVAHHFMYKLSSSLVFCFWLSLYNDSFHHSNSGVFCYKIHSFPESVS